MNKYKKLTNVVKKEEQLEMNMSTASYALRKKILFSFIVRAGENTCYRCGLKIENEEDLTIDHKISWLDVDPALFWDLDNVAFSHPICNSKAQRPRLPKTHCPRGHSYTGDSVYLTKTGSKICKICRRTQQKILRG